ncbi:MAG TPA: phosphoribosyltransferase family protein [Planctomycetota bacterium]|nr:phosphoribosyltransferase family protein [Planctomycetota bacterium]
MNRFATAIGVLADLVLPAVCPACRVAAGPELCAACVALAPRLVAPCPRCTAPESGVPCRACRGRGMAHIARVHVACVYAGVVEDLVGDAKAGARPAAARALEALMPELPADARFDVVVPVPPAAGRRPGPHLGSALARAIARRLGLPCRRLLRQARAASEQHRLSYADRRRNVAELFTSAPAPARVLLVDDLVTSGATASAAAGALKLAGAMRVELACLARTPKHDER